MSSSGWRAAVAACAVVVAVGCSSSTDGEPVAAKPATPQEWVSQMCGAVTSFQDDVKASTAEPLPADVAERKARMVEVLDVLGNELNELADSIDALGQPDVDDLQTDVGEFTAALRQSATDVEQLEEEASELDETRAALDEFGSQAESRIDEAMEPVADFDVRDESAELGEIYERTSECEGI